MRAAVVHRQIFRVLVFELIPGSSLHVERVEALVTTALRVLASIHSSLIPEGLNDHFHGEGLRNRLEQELEFVRRWTGIGADRVDVIRGAIDRPELSRAELLEVSPVLGHGDYQASNLLCTHGGEIVPIDWVDSGPCDHRYEWAHFLNSLDGVFGAGPGIERFGELARQILCPGADEMAFERDLRLGEIIDRVIVAGAKARNAIRHGESAELLDAFDKQVARLVSIL